MIDENTVRTAKAEAKRFLERVKALEERSRKDATAINYLGFCGCSETGAVRRASMDLTRALADLRRPEGAR